MNFVRSMIQKITGRKNLKIKMKKKIKNKKEEKPKGKLIVVNKKPRKTVIYNEGWDHSFGINE